MFDWEVPTIALVLGRLHTVVVRLNREDRLVWENGPNGAYNVRSETRFFGDLSDNQDSWKDMWYPLVPLKIQFFMWVASLGKIFMIDALR